MSPTNRFGVAVCIFGSVYPLLETWNRTIGPWTGSTVATMGIAHTAPIALLALVVGYLGLALWLLVALVRRAYGRSDSARAPRAPMPLLIAGGLMVLLPIIPASLVGTAFVKVCGPGKGSASFAHMAIEADSATLLKTVIDRGGSVADMSRTTPAPLDFAAAKGRPELVRMLLSHDAEVNARGSVGYTALMLAADNGHTEVVRLLLRAGADPHLRNGLGESALDLALKGGNQEIIDELRRVR